MTTGLPSTAPATAPGTPLVVACLRVTDLRPEVDPLTGAVARDAWGVGLSRADAAALELALVAAESWGGRVVAVTAGPEGAEGVLREAMALGAGALRVPWPPDPRRSPGHVPAGPLESGQVYADDLAGDERALARALVGALAPAGRPDLVVCGDRSADRGTGALPALVAHELGAAQALGLVRLDVAGDALLAERRLDGGRRERLRVPRPAVCSVEGTAARLRRAPLTGVLAAGDADVPVAAAPGPAVPPGAPVAVGSTRPFRPRARVLPPPREDDPRLRLLSLTGALVAHEPPTVIGPVDPAGAADALVAYLVRHGYLEGPPPRDGEAGRAAGSPR